MIYGTDIDGRIQGAPLHVDYFLMRPSTTT